MILLYKSRFLVNFFIIIFILTSTITTVTKKVLAVLPLPYQPKVATANRIEKYVNFYLMEFH